MTFAVRILTALGSILAGLAQAQAGPVTLTGSAVSLTGLGDTIGTDYDKLNVHAFGPVAVALQHAVPVTVGLGAFDFIVDINARVPHTYENLTLAVPFAVDGVSGVLSQPFRLRIDTSDTLTLLTGEPTGFTLPSGSHVFVTLQGQDPVTVGPVRGTYRGVLRAEIVEMPEPATLAVFCGLALAGVVGRRRRKATAAA